MKIRSILAAGVIALLLASIAVQATNISSVKEEKTTHGFLSKMPAENRDRIKSGLIGFWTTSEGKGECRFFPPWFVNRGGFAGFVGVYIKYTDKNATTITINEWKDAICEASTAINCPHTLIFVGLANGNIIIENESQIRLSLYSPLYPPILIE